MESGDQKGDRQRHRPQRHADLDDEKHWDRQGRKLLGSRDGLRAWLGHLTRLGGGRYPPGGD
jgi:hypothetical protein